MIKSWSPLTKETTMTTPERPVQADKIIVAITEAIIASQGGWSKSDGESTVR
jgi:hypothetical protein